MNRKNVIITVAILGLLSGTFFGFSTAFSANKKSVDISEENFTYAAGNAELVTSEYISSDADKCLDIVSYHANDAIYAGMTTEVLCGEETVCYIYSDGDNRYYASPDYDYVLKIEYGDKNRAYDAENILSGVINIKYDLCRKIDRSDYIHISEIDNYRETGTYGLFIIDEDGYVSVAYFHRNDDYNTTSDYVGENTAAELAIEGVNKKYADAVSGVTLVGTEFAYVLDKPVYNVELKGVDANGFDVSFFVKIDATSGDVKEVASSLGY